MTAIESTDRSNMSPAQLIDPEDIAINYNINQRGYTVRCSIYRAFSLIKPEWLEWITNKANKTF